MNKKIIFTGIIVALLGVALCFIWVKNSPEILPETSVEYKNSEFGFSFALPMSWKGYLVLNENWEGLIIDSPSSSKIVGPKISIRNPLWTVENPRQDIPIMIFTPDQWNLILQEKISLGAAPIGPSELGRNAKYIFALPARYNFAFPIGFEEVQAIIDSKPLIGF